MARRNTTHEVFVFEVDAQTSDLDKMRDALEGVGAEVRDIKSAGEAASAGAEKAEGALGRLGKAAGKVLGVLGKLAGVLGIGGAISISVAMAGAIGGIRELDGAMRNFSARTGVYGEALNEYRSIAEEVFTAGYGEDFNEVLNAMGLVHTLTGAEGEVLRRNTEYALAFSQIFDRDVNETVRTADTMMEVFGRSSRNTFDLLTTALQRTGDPAGDLLDTFNEYSRNFEELGFAPEQMLGTLIDGLEAGARNTDDIADGVREFGIRLRDGTSAVALYRLGLAGMAYDFRRGKVSGMEMMQAVIDGLREVDNQQERARLGADLFGTKWEDMGEGVWLALEPAADRFDLLQGSMEQAQLQIEGGLGMAWRRLTRTIKMSLVDAIEPYAMAFIEKLLPAADAFGSWLKEEGVPSAIDFAGKIADAASSAGDFVLALGGFDSYSDALQQTVDKINELADAASNLDPGTIRTFAIAFIVLSAPNIVGGIGLLAAKVSSAASAFFAGGYGLLTSPLILALGLAVAYETDFGGLRTSIDKTKEAFQDKDWGDAAEGIIGAFAAIPKGIAEALVGEDMIEEGLGVWGDIAEAGMLPEVLGIWATNALQGIVDAVNDWMLGAGATISESIAIPFVEAVTDAWDAIAGDDEDSLKSKLSNLPDDVKEWLSGLADAASELASGFVDAFIGVFSELGKQFIDVLNDAIPDEINIDFGWPIGSTSIDLPDNPIPGGTRDVGGPGHAGVGYSIVSPLGGEVFVPAVSGNFFTGKQLATALAGAGGGGSNAVVHNYAGAVFNFYGVQDVRALERALEEERRRRNVRVQ